VLCCAVLCCAVLCCAVLCCAVLCCCVLRCAVLCCAVLRLIVLCCVVLCCDWQTELGQEFRDRLRTAVSVDNPFDSNGGLNTSYLFATALDPRTKHLNLLTALEAQQIKEKLKALISTDVKSDSSASAAASSSASAASGSSASAASGSSASAASGSSASAASNSSASAPAGASASTSARKRKLTPKEPALPPKVAQTVTNEVDEFFDHAKTPWVRFEAKLDPLKWWAAHAQRFPALSRLARIYLAAPATSTQCERIFSHAGLILNARRCGMSVASLESLCFLYENQDLLKPLRIPPSRGKRTRSVVEIPDGEQNPALYPPQYCDPVYPSANLA
jgi:hypothetical protein